MNITSVLPQDYCHELADHPAHVHITAPKYCPGRFTPRLHGGISGEPAPGWTEDNPFAGIDDVDED